MVLNSVELHANETRLDELLRNVRQIYRRMGVLRATGRHSEALDLEIDEFSGALSLAHDAGATERQTADALAEEATRIENATALAEILAPLLAAKLRPEAAAAISSAAPAPAAAQPILPSSGPTAHTNTAITASPRPRTPPSSSPTVADLLEGMFAQQSDAPRTRP